MTANPGFNRLVLAASLASALAALCAAGWADPDETKEGQAMLKIEWREGPEYPMGIQEAFMGVIGGKLVAGGGFTRSPKNVVKLHPDAFDGQPSGFTKLVFVFNPSDEAAGWARIADVPGPPRQGAASTVVDDKLYITGGFNYSEPLTYRETYRLSQVDGEWLWEQLPCDLPFPLTEASAAAVGSKVYVLGGADYFKAPDAPNADFHAEFGRDGTPVGRALLMLDTENIAAGWQRLADLPGTARFDCGATASGAKVYVLGGIFSPLKGTPGQSLYHNVVDSWAYDTEAGTWERLADMPHGANRRALPFADRYILLVAGYKYGKTRNLDGSVSEIYTPEEKKLGWKAFFETTVLAYDTQTGTLAEVDPLLDKTSWPTATLSGDTVYCLGGEGGTRLWHPATFQIGKIVQPEG